MTVSCFFSNVVLNPGSQLRSVTAVQMQVDRDGLGVTLWEVLKTLEVELRNTRIP